MSNLAESHHWKMLSWLLSFCTLEFMVNPCQREQCDDPLPWSCDRVLQLRGGGRERGIHVIYSATCRSTTLLQQLSSSSFHGTHGLPRQKHGLAIDQKMSSVPACIENLQYRPNWLEHLHADLCNTLCLCYPGFSKIRDEAVTIWHQRLDVAAVRRSLEWRYMWLA